MFRNAAKLLALAGLVALTLLWRPPAPISATGNSITSPDTNNGVGWETSLALDASGFPVVSYYDSFNGDLKVLHCNDVDCSGGDESITSADTGGDLGRYTSLVLDGSGNPVVSYYHQTPSFDLKLLHCGNANCTSGNSITSPDSGATAVGEYTSLVLDAGGNPVVSYFDSDNGDLKILHCNDTNCSGGGESITSPDTGGTVGRFTSLALDASGFPVVSYYGQSTADLKILHCNDVNCSGGGESITLPDTGGTVGLFTSLALDGSGNPVVSYYDVTNGALKVLHCNDANCAGGGESITSPDTVDDTGLYTSLKLDGGGDPVVSYWDQTNKNLKLLRCGNANCTSGNVVTAPDTGVDVGRFDVLALDGSGKPVVSYYDAINGDLKLLHCGDVTCAAVTAFTVDSTSDIVDANPGNGVCDDGAGNCTLRAAIQETNALAGAETIKLPAGKYVLTIAGTGENAAATGDLDITDDVTITGAGADVTIIDGDALDRVFQILGSGSVVAMTGITLTNGSANSGGGILSSGTLTLVSSQVSGNTASSGSGGIDNGGSGDVTIDSSTISNNIAGSSGGGIGNLSGGLTIINSTISGNTAGADGGGIFQDDLDGAVELRNVTITNNSAAPGSGGGIAWDASTSANIRNTIIAGNDSAEGPDCFTLSGEKLTSQGYNLIGNNTDCTFNATTGDQIGTGVTPIDPLIGTLQDNGGPTLTHALPAVSPAIDAGNPGPPGSGGGTCEPAGQRGEARAKDGDSNGLSLCDIGSFEAEGVAAAAGEPFTFDASLDIELNLIPTSCEATGHLSAAFDPVGDGDTDNLDDVAIEITALSGFIDCPGPIFAGSSIPNEGVIEEQVDVTPGQLDFPANGDFTLCIVADTYPFGVLRNCPDGAEPEDKEPLNISCKIFSLLSFDCEIVGTSTFFDESDTEVAVVQSGDMALQQMAPVGGIAEAPDVEAAALERAGSSGIWAGAVAGIVAGVAASVLALGGAGWYARRRRRG